MVTAAECRRGAADSERSPRHHLHRKSPGPPTSGRPPRRRGRTESGSPPLSRKHAIAALAKVHQPRHWCRLGHRMVAAPLATKWRYKPAGVRSSKGPRTMRVVDERQITPGAADVA